MLRTFYSTPLRPKNRDPFRYLSGKLINLRQSPWV